MKTHKIKAWTKFFEPAISGEKTFEVRKDDRDYCVGDILLLKEFDPVAKRYTGREVEKEVTYLLRGPAFGLKRGHVIMAFGEAR